MLDSFSSLSPRSSSVGTTLASVFGPYDLVCIVECGSFLIAIKRDHFISWSCTADVAYQGQPEDTSTDDEGRNLI